MDIDSSLLFLSVTLLAVSISLKMIIGTVIDIKTLRHLDTYGKDEFPFAAQKTNKQLKHKLIGLPKKKQPKLRLINGDKK